MTATLRFTSDQPQLESELIQLISANVVRLFSAAAMLRDPAKQPVTVPEHGEHGKRVQEVGLPVLEP